MIGRPLAALAAAALLVAGAIGAAFVGRGPRVVRGPVVLHRGQHLYRVRVDGGIRIVGDRVTVRDVTVVGGENGIDVESARGVVLDRVTVRGALLDGIHVRRSTVDVRDCRIESHGLFAQGIDISFGFDVGTSRVSGCTVVGGQEGIVTHSAHVALRDNTVRGTSMRGITMTEMSTASALGNRVDGALGVGIFCGDYSTCRIDGNVVSGTRPDRTSGDLTRQGVGIEAHRGATAKLHGNVVSASPGGIAAFVESARIIRGGG